MIAALELDRRLRRAGPRRRLPGRVAAGDAASPSPRWSLLVLGAALASWRSAAAARLRGAAACRCARAARPPAANRWLDAQRPADHGPRAHPAGARSGVARHALRARPVADGRAADDAARAGRRAAGGRADAGARASRCCSSSASRASPASGSVDFVGPWALGPALGVVLLVARAARRGPDRRDAGDALPRPVRDHPRGARPAHRAWRARCARSSPSRSATGRSRSPTGCPTASASSTSTAGPSTLPEPGSGRAWTAVERDGRRVAAIIHDAALDTLARARAGGRGGLLAGDRQRAPAGRPAGAGGGAAGVAAADHGGG